MSAETADEKWATLPGHDLYEVSDQGRVRSYANRWGRRAEARQLSIRILEQKPGRLTQYATARLMVDGRQKDRLVHQLVLEAFVGPRPKGAEIRHLNGRGWDNRLVNLAYGTRSENMRDIVRHGTGLAARTHCAQGHPFAGDNLVIRKDNGSRACRECRRLSASRNNARRRGKAVAA